MTAPAFRTLFNAIPDARYGRYRGMPFEVLATLPGAEEGCEEDRDMYRIRLANGLELDAFGEEVRRDCWHSHGITPDLEREED